MTIPKGVNMRVSIAMAVCYLEKYLAEQIDSILDMMSPEE